MAETKLSEPIAVSMAHAIASIARPSKATLRHRRSSGRFFKTRLILARWLIQAMTAPRSGWLNCSEFSFDRGLPPISEGSLRFAGG